MAGGDAAIVGATRAQGKSVVMDASPNKVDCSQLSSRQLTELLHKLPAESSIELLIGEAGTAKLSGLCSGLKEHVQVLLQGAAGDFCYLLGAEAALEIRGSAGECLGHSMRSGQISLHGPAGRCVASYATGGFVAVLGQAGDYCGLGLDGADVLIRSRCGHRAGWQMNSGTLVLGNGAGDELGAGMTGGVIYVRGEVKSKSDSIRAERFKDTDALRLSLLMARAGIKANGAEFKVYRAKGTTT